MAGQTVTVNIFIFGVYDIWRKLVFEQVSAFPNATILIHFCMAFNSVLDLAEAAFH